MTLGSPIRSSATGPLDLLYLPAFMSNLDWHWEYAPHARFLERLASFSRLIVVDRRGWGCSDRVAPGSFPPLETAADDLIAVLDAVGSSRAAVSAGNEGGWVASIAAATHPERFSALVPVRRVSHGTPYGGNPVEPVAGEHEAAKAFWRESNTNRWTEAWVPDYMPSVAGDREAIEWLAKLGRGRLVRGQRSRVRSVHGDPHPSHPAGRPRSDPCALPS